MASTYLRFADLCSRGIVSNRVTLYRWIKTQGFPRPIKLGPNTAVWRADQVEHWLAAREQSN